MRKRIKELYEELKVMIHGIIKIKKKIIYKIMKIVYDLKYRQVTYIPEKGVWVSTVVFPTEMIDGIYGVTDVFPGNEKKVDFDALHTVYIKKPSDAIRIHRSAVKCIRNGYNCGACSEQAL